MNRRLALTLIAAAAACGMTACSSSGGASPTKGPSSGPSGSSSRPPTSSASTLVQPSNVPKTVPNTPALRPSVTLTSCGASTGGWKAGGTVKNRKGKSAHYVITVFFTTAKATVIGFGETTVTVAGGKSATWAVAKKFPAQQDTKCVLRGVGLAKR